MPRPQLPVCFSFTIAFLPVLDVIDGFDELTEDESVPEEFITYFQSTYIGYFGAEGPTEKGQHLRSLWICGMLMQDFYLLTLFHDPITVTKLLINLWQTAFQGYIQTYGCW